MHTLAFAVFCKDLDSHLNYLERSKHNISRFIQLGKKKLNLLSVLFYSIYCCCGYIAIQKLHEILLRAPYSEQDGALSSGMPVL